MRNIDVAKDKLTVGTLDDISYQTFSHMASFYGRFMEPHRHEGYYQLHYIDHGYINLNLDATLNLTPKVPLIILTPPSCPHAFFSTNVTTGHVLTVREGILNPMIENLCTTNPHLVNLKAMCLSFPEGGEVNQNLDHFFDIIKTAADKSKKCQDIVLAHVVQAMFAYIFTHDSFKDEFTGNGSTCGDLSLFQQYVRLIETNYAKQLTVSDYAKLMAVTESRLKEVCRRFSSISPKRMIFERVSLEAKRRLVYSDTPVTKIAAELGFDDPSYFARFFVRCVGQSPTQWRKRSHNIQQMYSDISTINDPALSGELIPAPEGLAQIASPAPKQKTRKPRSSNTKAAKNATEDPS
ncbi:MAG: helix-turn-helix domain-containing protein [Anaerobiospirillum succiniciproducens]|uniref:helix-turn-helix domain-containing protein n=1 Tax=Anaerobiospirillum succiniciproducens TaxID=13335 RepID=UPI002357B264|nr:helix-turn-helix domain-containing protein [Anaerobiospirillum succiniciproducens]MCI6864527.1 AraC family transcriptional regulator [Anaerobiospirillum succiniciproducens]MDY2799336.1 helix-turn-helix domain-containing protein [Anaerobiospirillum succiniciproducens]